MARKKKPVDEVNDCVIPLSDLQAGDFFHLGDDSYRVQRQKAGGDSEYIVVRLQEISVNQGHGEVATQVIGVETLTLPGNTKVIET